MDLNNKSILVTGGTGSFGRAFIKKTLSQFPQVKKIVVFSRDEQKQFDMMNDYPASSYPCLEFMLGDVRNRDRVIEVARDMDIIVHSAAMKHVPAAEMNPMECVQTNILGSQNVVDAAMINNVKVVVALSTDKAASPINFYGASKLCLEKLFTYADLKKREKDIRFSVVRYANVFGSKGSVVPLFLKLKKQGYLPITSKEMTRFSITMDTAVNLVYYAINNGWGGEIILPESASYKITDLATALAPEVEQREVGIRTGEKIHETMFTEIDSFNTVQRDKYFVICPPKGLGLWTIDDYLAKNPEAKKVTENLAYSSNTNKRWLQVNDIKQLLEDYLALL